MDLDKHLPSILAWGGALVTGVFTLLGVWLAHRNALRQLESRLNHESAKETREVLRVRLEELYTLGSRWSGEVVMHHVTYRKVMEGLLTYNQALDITIGKASAADANRMFTLADLYFPTARKTFGRLKGLRDEASLLQAEFKEIYRHSGAQSPEYAAALTKVLEAFNVAVEEYKQSLSAHAMDVSSFAQADTHRHAVPGPHLILGLPRPAA